MSFHRIRRNYRRYQRNRVPTDKYFWGDITGFYVTQHHRTSKNFIFPLNLEFFLSLRKPSWNFQFLTERRLLEYCSGHIWSAEEFIQSIIHYLFLLNIMEKNSQRITFTKVRSLFTKQCNTNKPMFTGVIKQCELTKVVVQDRTCV